MTTPRQRQAMHEAMRQLLAHEPQIHYRQARPMGSLTRFHDVPGLTAFLKGGGELSVDCSESATLICKLGGLADPNGNHYDGAGFTGTLLEHLPHYANPAGAATGALVVFGPGTGEHVCVVYEPDRHDPLLFSHGQERGPILIKLSAERQFHTAPVTFLSIAALG